jgi:hypothetical protein
MVFIEDIGWPWQILAAGIADSAKQCLFFRSISAYSRKSHGTNPASTFDPLLYLSDNCPIFLYKSKSQTQGVRMRRLSWTLLFIGVLACYSSSYAFLRLGIKAGANFASVTVKNSSNVSYKMKPGFSAGAQADIALLPTLSVRTDVLYVQKGTKFTTPTTSDGKVKLDEFVVAPFLVMRFPLAKVIPFVQAGPEIGLNTLAKEEQGGNSANASPHFKKSDFSINLGAGVILPVGMNDLTLDARYNLGLVDVNKDTGSASTKLNGIQIFAGFNFLKI